MIAETANLATAHKVVKRGYNGRRPDEQLTLRMIIEPETESGRDLRNAGRAEIIKNTVVLTQLHIIVLEQNGQTGCLIACRPEKQPRTALCILFGRGTSE